MDGSVPRPDDQPPLILVPGAFGSSLRECSSGREIWPVSDSRLLFSDYRELALPIDPATLEPDANNAEAYAVFREGLGRDFYGGVIDMLQREGGYERCVPGTPPRRCRRLWPVPLPVRLPARQRARRPRTRGTDRPHPGRPW